MFKCNEINVEIRRTWHKIKLTNIRDWSDMCDFIEAQFTEPFAVELMGADDPDMYIKNDADALLFKLTCIK